MEIIILDNYSDAINRAAEVIKSGGLVVFPSDTVYGLAVDPTNEAAVQKLLGFKDRWIGKAISIAVASIDMAKKYVEFTSDTQRVYDNLLPGPFTVISNGLHTTAPGIEAENGTLGIRIPKNEFMNDLAGELGAAFTATSANLSGRSPHYTVDSLLTTLSEKKKAMIDLVIDGGKLPPNKPSTVIDITQPEIKVLRRGDLVTGKTTALISKSEEETARIAEFVFDKITKPNAQCPNKSQKSKDKLRTKPIVLCLTGDLGCGKTVFSRAVGRTLGVTEKITSPTFFIYNEYKIIKPKAQSPKIMKFLHFDLYRISGKYELEEIKFLDLFEENTVACIEWPENMGEEYLALLKAKCDFHMIGFEYVDAGTREIRY